MRIPIISRFLERRSRSDLLNPKKWLLDALGVRKSLAGVNVTEDTAMRLSAVYACVRIIAETIASLPLNVYRRLKRGKEKATDHPLFDILHNKPNEDMTSFTYRETLMSHLLLWGNHYSEINLTQGGDVYSLYPLLSSRMDVKLKNGKIIYLYKQDDGSQVELSKNRVLHIPGLSFNGIVGKSPIAMAREAIGLGMALEEFGSRFFANGTNIGGIAMHPGRLGDKAYENLKKSLEEQYQGLGKSHRLLILEEGMKYEKVTIPPNDAQFLEARKFQLEEIARIFRVPLHLLQNLDRGTFSNIEHQSIDFVVHTIRPWLVRIEQAINTQLFSEEERKEYFAEFVVDGLLRGDIESRYRAYAQGRQNGWLSANDIRELENMNPIENGDIYLVPLNMIDASQVANTQTKQKPKNTEENKINLREERSIRSAITRARLARSYQGLFENVMVRLIKRERVDILNIAKKSFKDRDITLFREKVEEYYKDYVDFLITHTKPVFKTYAEAIEAEAKAEVDFDGDSGLDKFMEDYQTAFNLRYTKENSGRLQNVAQKAVDNGGDPIKTLEDEFDRWEEKKPEQRSLKETIKIAGAVSIVVYKAAGISKLIWRNTGSKSCPYCQALDGKVVGIEETFIPAGVDFNPEGADGSMKISGPKFHPPLHDGCICQITAGY